MPQSYKIIIASLAVLLINGGVARASLIDDLRHKITDRSKEIEKLDQEIKQFQTQVETAKREAGSLQTEIKRIDSTEKRLTTDIVKTEKQITITSTQIKRLTADIQTTEQKIELQRLALEQAMRTLRETEDISLVEVALSADNLSSLMAATETLETLNHQIDQAIFNLVDSKQDLSTKRQSAETAQQKLATAKSRLADEKALAAQAKREKDLLLAETKNKEANYQKQLQDRLIKKQQVEAEMRAYEEQLRVVIDPSSLPRPGQGVLAWPLDKVTITQYFGNTEFASKNPQIYKGQGHNGVDLRAAVGTPVRAAAAGTIAGVGDTDTACKGASYGKWIMVTHTNGLSTVYAHLSLPKVTEGQTVGRGEIIGYSGNTGYSTGPHLHFSVFASQGVKVGLLQSKVPGCGIYRVPLASYNSYLNPLSYL